MRKHTYQWWEVAAGLAVAGFLVFGRGLAGELVLDDTAQLSDNVLVHSFKYIPNLWFGSTFYAGNNQALQGLYYRPVMLLVFSLIYHFFGIHVAPYHLIQLSLHIANATLFYYVLKKFIKPLPALLASLVFLVHPINTEAVVYISNLQDVLLAHFGLWALWVLLYKKTTWTVTRRFWVVMLLLEMSLMSKEIGVLWVIIIWGYIYFWDRGRFRRFLWGGLGVLTLYAAMRLQAIGWPSSDRVIPIAAATFGERLLTIPRIWWYYLSLFMFPNHMAIAQNWVVRHISFRDVWQPLLLVGVVLGGLVTLSWNILQSYPLRKLWRWWWGWFFVGLLVHSQLFPLDVTVADRWFYTPGMALIALLAAQLAQGAYRVPGRERFAKIPLGVCIVIIGALSVRTFVRVGDWRTAFSLYAHDYQIVGSSFTIDNNLGLEYLKQGQLDQAEEYLTRSVKSVPHWGISWNNLGITYEFKGDQTGNPEWYRQAQDAYEHAIQYPAGYSPFLNLARLLVEKIKDPQPKTRLFLQEALKRYPENPDLWYLLAEWENKYGSVEHASQATKQFNRLMEPQIR